MTNDKKLEHLPTCTHPPRVYFAGGAEFEIPCQGHIVFRTDEGVACCILWTGRIIISLYPSSIGRPAVHRSAAGRRRELTVLARYVRSGAGYSNSAHRVI